MINEITEGKHKQFHRSSFIILFSLIVFISGCSGSIKHGIKQYIRPNTDISVIRAIAVLPLENFTSDNYADGKIKSKIIIELLSRGIDVIEPGEVVMTLRELRVRSIDSIRTEDIQNIGKTLNIDAVMLGSVEAFGISMVKLSGQRGILREVRAFGPDTLALKAERWITLLQWL
jgi:TolB-like protein